MKARITLVKANGEEAQLWFDTPAEITVGRSQNCSCSIDDDAMLSRMHAVLLIDPPVIRLKDLNSTNGVVINGEVFGGTAGEKLVQARDVRESDEVVIGNTILHIALVEDVDAPDVVSQPETVVKPVKVKQSRLPGSHSTVAGLGEAGVGGDTVKNSLTSLAPAIPGYEVRAFVGSGRTGSVYKAVDLASGDTVAIKVTYPELMFTRKTADAFKRGIDELKPVSHSGLVKYLASGDVRVNSVYFVSEFVSGVNLTTHLDRFPRRSMPVAEACALFTNVCAALQFAHRQGLLHRDMRPGKVMVDRDRGGQVKVADIGLARVFDEAGMSVAGRQRFDPATLAYLAPEQLLELRELKPSVDVFSAGAVFYEMLTGMAPYNFTAQKDPADTVAAADIVPVEERRNDLPEPLVVVLERCLLPEPEYRYQNCGDLLEALGNVRV